MRNPLIMLLVMSLLLMVIVAPFSGLALLMGVLLVSMVASIVWTMVRTLVSGNS